MAAYHQTCVEEFHTAFAHPVAYAPAMPSMELRLLRVRLLLEEVVEFAQAVGVDVQVAMMDGNAVVFEVDPAIDHSKVNLVEAADGLGDIRYVTDGANLVFGFPGEAVLAEIHRSNMSKLGEDGRPILREDGKILKGPNYTPPNIAKVLGL